MDINKGVAGTLAAACLTVGAAGAYLATRGSERSTDLDAQTQAANVDHSSAAAEGAVEQSEGVIADSATTDTGDQRSAGATPTSASASTRSASPAAPSTPRPPARAAAPAARATTSSAGRSPRPTEPAVEQPSYSPRDEARIATPPAIEAVRTPDPEPARAPDPPAPPFEELVVSADSVIGLEVETSITSERARIEDAVVARVTRDVKVGDRVAISAGSKAHGEVTLVERGGRVRDRARLGIRFTSVVLADGTRVPLETETIYREGSGPGNESAAKIGGGAIGGAILGGILGGAKGAIIGGSAGAGASTAAVMAGGRNAATLPSGTPVTVRVAKPATVTVEK